MSTPLGFSVLFLELTLTSDLPPEGTNKVQHSIKHSLAFTTYHTHRLTAGSFFINDLLPVS